MEKTPSYPIILKPQSRFLNVEKSFFSTLMPLKPEFTSSPPNKNDYDLNIFFVFLGYILFFPLVICILMFLFGVVPSIISGDGNMKNEFMSILLTVFVLSMIEYLIYQKKKDNEQVYSKKVEVYVNQKKNAKLLYLSLSRYLFLIFSFINSYPFFFSRT